MINYMRRLFTVASVRIEQHESAQMPGVPEIVRIDTYCSTWKLALLLCICASMSSVLTVIALWYLLLVLAIGLSS